MSICLKVICFIVCHVGPADHFATIADHLKEHGYEVQIYASNPALLRLQERNVRCISFSADEPGIEKILAEEIAKKSSVIITDVGHRFSVNLQKRFASECPEILRLAYYDNLEPYVPGGYSSIAKQVMQSSQKVVFANANLAHLPIYDDEKKEIDLSSQERIGLGYFPIERSKKIAAARKDQKSHLRGEFLNKHNIEDYGQKVLVYFGGNNQAYFDHAFLAFIRFVKESENHNCVFVIQQHPGARGKRYENEKILDLDKCVIISEESSEYMQIIADKILYYQTSMAIQFALAGIPTIQVGENVYEDILIKSKVSVSATNGQDFGKAISYDEKRELDEDTLFEMVGMKSNWLEAFIQAI